MKIIPLKASPIAIASAEDFKAGDVYGIAWQWDTPMYPAARRMDSMPPAEAATLLQAIKARQDTPPGAPLRDIPEGLYYLISSYGVPIVWVTCDGTIYCTKFRHSDATAKHIKIAEIGIQALSQKIPQMLKLNN